MNKPKIEKLTFVVFTVIAFIFFAIAIYYQVYFFRWLEITKYINWNLQIVALLTFFVGAIFFVFPFYLYWKNNAIMDIPTALKSITKEIGNLDLVAKEHQNTKVTYENLKNELNKEIEVILGIGDSLKNNISLYKNIENQVFELRQTNTKLNKNIENWNKVSIEFVESVYRPLSYADIDENYKLALNKVVKDFREFFSGVGLDIIVPEVGSNFNDLLHEIREVRESEELEPNTILECIEPGFRTGESILRRSKVIISKKTNNKFIIGEFND